MRRADGSFAFNPGTARDKLVAQRAISVTQDSRGQDVPVYGTLYTIWGNVRAMQGKELEAAGQRWAEARFKIETWTPPVPLQRSDRLLWGTRVLDILDAEDPAGAGRTILIYCREVL
jgi:head-tail adaptor